MVKQNNIPTGNQGEQLAMEYLQANGYEVLARNWRHNKAELDIICQKDGTTIFVEVKTRRGTAFGKPEDGVTLTKQKHLARGANAYIMQFDIHTDVRFDIVSIMLAKGKAAEILHIEDAFFPMGDAY